jgi:hypothetical protein
MLVYSGKDNDKGFRDRNDLDPFSNSKSDRDLSRGDFGLRIRITTS